MADFKLRLANEALRSIDSSTFNGAYQNLGTAFQNPTRIFKITNDSTVGITVSFDGGSQDDEYIPAGGFLLIDVSANKICNRILVAPAGTQVAVKGSAGTGTVYLSTYYAR